MKLKSLLPFVGLILFAYLIYSIGLNTLSEAFLKVNTTFLLLGSLAILIKPFLESLKWYSILRYQGIKIDFPYIFRVNFISQYYGAITPGKVGSLMKAVYLRKKLNKPLAFTSSSVMIDRILDLIVVAGMASVGLLILADAFFIDFNKTIILIALVLAGCLILLNKNLTKVFLKIAYTYFAPNKYKFKLREGFYNFYDNFPKAQNFIIPFLITAAIWVFMYSIHYLFALAFSITQIPFIPFIMINALGTIIALIPITISGLGTREAFYLAALGIYGAQPENIILMSVVGTIILTTIYVVGGLICLYEGKVTL